MLKCGKSSALRILICRNNLSSGGRGSFTSESDGHILARACVHVCRLVVAVVVAWKNVVSHQPFGLLFVVLGSSVVAVVVSAASQMATPMHAYVRMYVDSLSLL